MDFGYFNLVLNAITFLALAAVAVVYYKSSLSANTIKLYKENQEAQTVRLNSLEEELSTSKISQSELREEIRVIRSLPLGQITSSLQAVIETQNTILKTQNIILHFLETSTVSTTNVNVAAPTK